MAYRVTLHRLVVRASAVLVLGGAAFGCASGSENTEDLPPITYDSSVDTGSGEGDTGISIDSSTDSGGGDVAVDTGPGGCKTNADCASDPAGKYCLPGGDGGPGFCVPCLPKPSDPCGPGTYCSDTTYTCETGCKTNDDCRPSTGGDAGADGGEADAADAGGDAGTVLTCDTTKHRCVGCVADDDCPLGSLCDRTAGACVPGCNVKHGCATGKDCCTGKCYDTQKDINNCGTCGNVCPAPANATAGCSAGVCGVGTCNTGWGDCNSVAADGCETNTLTNKDNCGVCGNACALANATAACTAGACSIASCNGGFDDCNKIASDGCETSLKSLTNCGACGTECNIPQGTGSCSTGTCKVVGCNVGYGDCDGLTVNGCETNTAGGTPGPSGSILNCGSCGTNCSVANGTPQCSAGTCGIQSCNTGWGDCNSTYADGCETNTTTNLLNCGGCGNACSTVGGTASCASSTCGITCSPGYGNCDSSAVNGCEINVTNDVNNCGGCGAKCTPDSSTHVLTTKCNPSGSTGNCGVATCASGYYDYDKSYANGCECHEDTVGNTCGGALDLGTINLDVSPPKSVSGNLSGTLSGGADGDEDWYKITFQIGPSCSYTPSISLSGTDVKMAVYTGCSGAVPSGSFSCGGGSEPANSVNGTSGIDSWNFTQNGTCGTYQAHDPYPQTAGSFLTTVNVVYVRIFRSAAGTSCYPYTLTIGN